MENVLRSDRNSTIMGGMGIQILPSLLAADFGRLGDEIRRAASSGSDALHLDIMDAHFVPNLSFGPDVVALAKRTAPAFHRHTHLMMTRPDLYLEPFAAAGAQTLQIHVEADVDVHDGLRAIAARGIRPAIALNPETPAEAVFPYLVDCGECLVMTVHPGYGGQKFIAGCLAKITAIRRRATMLGKNDFTIMIDGGADAETAAAAARAGANAFVAGSYLFKQTNMAAAVAALRNTCEEAYGTDA